MRLVRTGTWARIENATDREAVYRVLDPRFSYRVEGAHWAPSYRAGRWDGRIHLVRRVQSGDLIFPAGLYPEARSRLYAAGVEFEEEDRRRDRPVVQRTWSGPVLREYQDEAVQEALDADGGGILKLPIRSGKTLIAARVIERLAQRALVLVPSDLLLRQTIRAMRSAVSGARVVPGGRMLPEGEGDIVVATIQSLVGWRKQRRFAAFGRGFGVAFFDEVHHLRTDQGRAWRDVALSIDARRKYGLSATVNIDRRRDNAQGDVWLRGLCGPILYDASISDLIGAGFLIRPTIRFHYHNAPKMPGSRWSAALYDAGIVHCAERNEVIVRVVVEEARAGRRVLVDVARIAHCQLLAAEIQRWLPYGTVEILRGDTSKADRERALYRYRKGDVRVIVGTIMGEGVDVPEMEVVVNAEAGKARVSTIQRLRNLTIADGKLGALVVEMVDDHHPVLRRWTRERVRIYQTEPSFRLELA